MRRRVVLPHHSRTEWGTRLALTGVAAVLGYFSVAFSLAQVTVKTDPVSAHRLAPYDGRITAALATALSEPEADAADRRRADELARLSLRQDPMAVGAVSTLGLDTDLRGDTAAARRLFNYAQKLSRRNLRTQLWTIEDAVNRGDVRGALRQYDVTLRVFPQISEVLYPILASASSDPEIRSELIKMFARKPVWGDSFITYVARKNPEPRETPTLFLALRRAGVAVPRVANVGAIEALFASGDAEAAWAYYATTRRGADRRRSRDPDFGTNFDTPSPFDWRLVGEGSTNATLQHGLFDFTAPGSINGPLLQQSQLLPPGSYRLSGHSIDVDQPADASPYWTLLCQNGSELGRVVMPNSAEANGTFAGTFTVPAGCLVQTLVLVARPSEAVSGMSIRIDRVQLAPVEEGKP